ncbi:MAG: hypothetical protein QM831_34645 [Kofleriaceae bacterium]
MKVLAVGALMIAAVGCLTDPPYRPYGAQQQGYGPQGPPPGGGPYQDPNAPPTYQTQLQPSGPQPPPYVPPDPNAPQQPPPSQQGGVTVAPTISPTTAPPGTYQTQLQPPPGSPPPGSSPTPPPSSYPPPAQPSSAAGRYQCWVAGAGMYAQSSLGLITLDFNQSYSSTSNAQATGTYRVDGPRVYFTGGAMAGYVGSLESNQNGPLLRLRTEVPNDPGPALRVGDHVCYLVR